jgi:GntR family transcriptional regulator
VRTAIASGELRPGAGLPSVRQLAGQLRINPATVVQAYRELEQEGFVELRQGSGSYVREIAADAGLRERSRQARALVRRMVSEAGRLRLSLDELREALADELDLEARR